MFKRIVTALILATLLAIAATPVISQDIERANSTIQRMLFGNGTALLPSVASRTTPGTGFWFPAANQLATSVSGVTYWNISGASTVAKNTALLGWSFGDPSVSGMDTQFSRVAAGQIAAGTSTSTPVITGTLTTSVTSTCTIADTALTDLWTYSLPANTLNTNGRGIRITIYFTTGATANNKTGQVTFGATTLASRVASADNGFIYKFVVDLIRTGATAQLSYSVSSLGAAGAATAVSALTTTTPAETLAGAILIKAQGQNGTAAANDVCVKMAHIETIW